MKEVNERLRKFKEQLPELKLELPSSKEVDSNRRVVNAKYKPKKYLLKKLAQLEQAGKQVIVSSLPPGYSSTEGKEAKENAHLRQENAHLRQENAQLRQEVEGLRMQVQAMPEGALTGEKRPSSGENTPSTSKKPRTGN
jgi:hypothetical protein